MSQGQPWDLLKIDEIFLGITREYTYSAASNELDSCYKKA